MKVLLVSEIKETLNKIGKQRELNKEQKIALEHSEKVALISAKKGRELVEELMKIGRINEKQACKIADLLPIGKDEVVAIFAKETYMPSDEEIDKIIETVKKYK
ncbi:MAG: RNA polymerase [Thermoplasmatales archaeon]|nr:RNA polymerase [Thermoplasmatales archaeon]